MRTRLHSAFTLTELLVVVVILSILAAVVVPQLVDSHREAEISAAKSSLRAIKAKIDEHYRINDEWPSDIEKSWFVGNRLPKSPWKDHYEGKAANIYGGADWHHPNTKVIETHDYPFWYSNLSGAVRIRVPSQATSRATLALYNRVNGTNATSLSQNAR